MEKEFYIPRGYRFAGVNCAIKPNSTKLDFSLIVSDRPATAAGVYTQNLNCGAPVIYDRERTPGSGFRVIATDSGVANACTGQLGLDHARRMAKYAGEAVGATAEQTLVMSTGVIGVHLPMDRVAIGAEEAAAVLGNALSDFEKAATAMMTTDTKIKTVSREKTLPNGVTIRIAGMCKGAAMIGPNMATMLASIITDAMLEPEDAQKLLRGAVEDTFNCISVEGHTSTSDTVLLLANGAADATPLKGEDLAVFGELLLDMCKELAPMIPNDGEGVTHLITIDVFGTPDRESAKKLAQTVANDALVKTAICGADPNWGRIISATGRCGVPYDPSKVSLKVNGFLLYENGTPVEFDKTVVSDSIRNNRDTSFELFFEEGDASIRFWTSDLTAEYVRLNADYTT
ncbi:MAG: bifunctional glutamate N-acetyltransferase/amino-acid acetyltransferase ArgJ [Thermoguttaceae bacterium]|jgi:glutamate N-acetyltransferase/amino-acid N-acetyltransferase|nr:bifunctional glutamate N-acetyltransferase/amino-acid acetyltransferase ArgJ [Thermoguttaceae bacterium]